MDIAISGATGYIGERLTAFLQSKGYTIKLVNRQLLYGDTEKLSNYLANTVAVINLAGAPILRRWTKRNKKIIYDSRIVTSLNITKAINNLPVDQKPKVYISASAIGIYKPDQTHNETSQRFDDGYVSQIVSNWEQASANLCSEVRRVIFRMGVVLGKESQTISRLLPLFKLGLGGKIGNGKQAFPFIHIDDLITAYTQSITDERYSDIINLVAPENVSNKEFTHILGKILKKPALFAVPGFMLKLIYGNASNLLLKNPIVVPAKLLEIQFPFKYPTMASCLKEITKMDV